MMLNKNQYELLKILGKSPCKKESIENLKNILKEDQSAVFGAALELAKDGYVEIITEKAQYISLGTEGFNFLKSGFIEKNLLSDIAKSDSWNIRNLPEISKYSKKECGLALGWLFRKRWCKKDKNGELNITEIGKKALEEKDDDEKLLELIGDNTIEINRLKDLRELQKIDFDRVFNNLRKRPAVLNIKEKTIRFVSLTESGAKLLEKGIKTQIEASELTHEMLVKAEWKNIGFKKYDVTVDVAPQYPGKTHPIRIII